MEQPIPRQHKPEINWNKLFRLIRTWKKHGALMRVNLIINIPGQSTILNYEIREEEVEEEEEQRDVISSVPRE